MPTNHLDSKSDNNKKHFAAALNSARHNFYVTLKHIGDILKLDTAADNEEQLANCALINALNPLNRKRLKSERLQKAVEQLDKNMPFLRGMLHCEIDYAVYLAKKKFKDDNPALFPKDGEPSYKTKQAQEKAGDRAKTPSASTYYNILLRIIRTLNAYRNEHTHFDPVGCWSNKNTIADQKIIVRYMLKLFDGARSKVKERFEYTEADMEFLTGKEHFDEVPVEDPETKKPKINSKGFKEKKHVERNDFYYLLWKVDNDGNTRLSATGLVMFTCLFINKQHAKMLIDQVHLHSGRHNTTERQKRIIFEIFSNYRIKLSRDRIESTTAENALMLDMFNELQKCPKELFDILSPEDQNLFRVAGKNDDADTNNYGDEYPMQNLMVRYTDRFPRLAMAYLDQAMVLDDIRFQVSLGKYRFEFYNKQCIDATDSDRVRALQKEINGFGRLNEIEAKRREKYAPLISDDNLTQVDTADTKPYITDHRAAYKITGNRIGMKVITDKSGMYLPELKGRDTQCLQPDCWLSIYELPALLFHHLLLSDENASATAVIIKDCIARYHKFFNDVKDGKISPVKGQAAFASLIEPYGISPNDVPQELQDYLSGKKVDIEQILEDRIYDAVNELIEQTRENLNKFRDKLKMVGSKDNKFGKKAHTEVKPGRLASELAKDIVKWQPSAPAHKNASKPQGWNKLTGLNYAVLQATLAQFKGNLDELKRLLVSAGILDGKYPHPFLADVINENPADMIELYDIYLNKQIKFLKGFEKYDDDKFNAIAHVLTHYSRNRWADRTDKWYKTLAGKYLSAPIELPRGLFESAIKQLVVESYSKDFPDLVAIAKSPRCNIAYLIARFNEIVYQDANQDFYYTDKGFTRTYNYFNLINNKKIRNQLQEVYLTIPQMAERVQEIKDENKEQKLINSITHYRADIQAQKREEMKKTLARSKRNYANNEKTIRRYKVQDILIFLLAKKLLSATMEKFDNRQQYHLCDIRPDSNKGILSTAFPFSVTLTFGEGRQVTIKQEQLKVKNFGDFFRFIYDGRLESLITHLDCTEIEREALEKEFENYDLTRPAIFEAIHKIEAEIIDACKIDENDTVKINFRKLLERKNGPTLDANSEIIIEIRNAFSHNRYPSKSIKQKSETSNDDEIKIDLNSALPEVASSSKTRLNGPKAQ